MRVGWKIPSWGSPIGIMRLADWWQTVIPRDRFFYPIHTRILDSFSCSPLSPAFRIERTWKKAFQNPNLVCEKHIRLQISSVGSVSSLSSWKKRWSLVTQWAHSKCSFGKVSTTRESNQASDVRKAHYAYKYVHVRKSSILLVGKGIRKNIFF